MALGRAAACPHITATLCVVTLPRVETTASAPMPAPRRRRATCAAPQAATTNHHNLLPHALADQTTTLQMPTSLKHQSHKHIYWCSRWQTFPLLSTGAVVHTVVRNASQQEEHWQKHGYEHGTCLQGKHAHVRTSLLSALRTAPHLVVVGSSPNCCIHSSASAL
jgi:hypothetical protein